jgi:hypothetical protein
LPGGLGKAGEAQDANPGNVTSKNMANVTLKKNVKR